MSVQSIERAFAVLRTLATGPSGVTELAEQVDLPKSTVARLLSALETEGAVAQVEQGGEYRLGQGLLDIAGATEPGRNLAATVRPWLLWISEEIGEAAGLSIVRDREIHYLDHAVPETDVMVRDWTGESLPIQSVPSGMAIMAGWSDAVLDEFLSHPLEASTAYTLVDPDEVRERISAVQSLGYAWGYEEGVDGINSVAVAIDDGSDTPVAALHVHGPAYRFPNPDRTHDIGMQLIEAAAGIAEQFTD
ncbi:MAG: IclR family transcriptional regulator [Actinomycetota bacterium]